MHLPKNGLLILNADDWGFSSLETDSAASCLDSGRLTSVSAMVFMEDSERAAELAKSKGVDVGLHLNLNEPFSGRRVPEQLSLCHARLCRFLNLNPHYSLVLYNPFLRKEFRYAYQTQIGEFLRLYGRAPSHVNGHLHKHLSSNMLLDKIIPSGQKVRRSFSFSPGERGWLNLAYRRLVNRCLQRSYVITDYFFSLRYCLENHRLSQVAEVAKSATVELVAHTKNCCESEFLKSDAFSELFKGVPTGNFSQLKPMRPYDVPAPVH